VRDGFFKLDVKAAGLAGGALGVVAFVICVAFGVLFRDFVAMRQLLEAMLPGFTWLTPASFLLGLVEAFLYGWYVALVFVPLFNYFEGGRRAGAEQPGMARPREALHHP